MPMSLQDCLQSLGANRVEATLLACLLESGDGIPTQEILAQTGLRQPEVSVGMRVLRERGWVDSEPIPREGKGRPMHKYDLRVRPSTVRSYYEDQAKARIQEYQRAVEALRQSLT